jgi:SagB-type dehydrogenase family enzyme
MAGLSGQFHQGTIYSRKKPFTGSKPQDRPEPFKEYPGSKKVKLETPALPAGSLWLSLKNRRSRRDFKKEPISKDQLALLLWAAQGGTEKNSGFQLRTAPSAGALYPIETYLVINRVEGLEPGVYHWNLIEQSLELLKAGDCSLEMEISALSQDMCRTGAVVFAWSAIFARSTFKYSDRGLRYIYMDAGHICENLYLACEDLKLGCCGVGAFFDDEVDALLGLDSKEEAAVYLAAVGKY